MAHNFDPIKDTVAMKFICKKARQLRRHRCFAEEEFCDLEQELTLQLWQFRNKYRQEHGHWHAYVRTVLRSHACNMLRHRKARMRDAKETVKFSTPVEANSGCTVKIGETITEGRLDARLGRERRTDTELSALRCDLKAVLTRFPARQRAALDLLMHMDKPEVAERMKVGRSTLDGWVRRIRIELAQAGVRDYMLISEQNRK